MMYDIILFENLRFRPFTHKQEIGVFQIATLESVFEKMRFQWPFSPDTCGRWSAKPEEKSMFSNKKKYVWTRP